MKHIWKTKLSLAIFIQISVFVEADIAQTNKTISVRFKPGTTAASYKDRVRGYAGIDYVLTVKEGQKMTENSQAVTDSCTSMS